MSPSMSRSRWANGWLHSDLIGIPVTLAGVGIVAISLALYLVIGRVAGLFVGKLVFVLAFGGLLGLILLLEGRQRENIETPSRAPAEGPRRVLVVANAGLEHAALCREICDPTGGSASEAMIIAPVTAPSRLHALADDIDTELTAAQSRVDTAVAMLASAGVPAAGASTSAHR
jgi:hypothetical protein